MKLFPGFSPEKIRRGEYRRELAAPLLVLAVFLLIRISARIDTALTRENELAAEILLQLLIFLFPAVLYLIFTGQNLSGMRLRPFGAGHLLLMFSSAVLLICGTLLINLLCFGYESLTGGYDLYGIFISKKGESTGDVIYLILAYALLPAICEEFVFRSLLCGEYEKRSTAAAILMPSLFFAMLHFDLEHFPSLFFCGLVLSFTMYATRTVLAPVCVHLLYNLVSVFGKPYFQTFYDLGGQAFFVFLVTALFLFFLFVFFAEASRLYRFYADRNYSSDYRKMNPPYTVSEDGAANPAAEFAVKHPRLTATAAAFLSPTALACYVFYFAVIFLF